MCLSVATPRKNFVLEWLTYTNIATFNFQLKEVKILETSLIFWSLLGTIAVLYMTWCMGKHYVQSTYLKGSQWTGRANI